jgi:hypothetical protein
VTNYRLFLARNFDKRFLRAHRNGIIIYKRGRVKILIAYQLRDKSNGMVTPLRYITP